VAHDPRFNRELDCPSRSEARSLLLMPLRAPHHHHAALAKIAATNAASPSASSPTTQTTQTTPATSASASSPAASSASSDTSTIAAYLSTTLPHSAFSGLAAPRAPALPPAASFASLSSAPAPRDLTAYRADGSNNDDDDDGDLGGGGDSTSMTSAPRVLSIFANYLTRELYHSLPDVLTQVPVPNMLPFARFGNARHGRPTLPDFMRVRRSAISRIDFYVDSGLFFTC
jgi:hypothetical protein